MCGLIFSFLHIQILICSLLHMSNISFSLYYICTAKEAREVEGRLRVPQLRRSPAHARSNVSFPVYYTCKLSFSVDYTSNFLFSVYYTCPTSLFQFTTHVRRSRRGRLKAAFACPSSAARLPTPGPTSRFQYTTFSSLLCIRFSLLHF